MVSKIFFQSSLPRAGSTLLQNIIGQNPDFYVTPTSGVLELLFAARGNYTNSPEFKAQDPQLMRDGWLSFCKNGMYGFYNGITDKPYVLDKSRGWGIHYDFLSTFIEEPKIICMVRDLRAIFASMEKNFRKNPEKSKNMVNWATGECTTIDKRVTNWAATPPIGIAIERLGEMINRKFDQQILFIKFEDLTRHPKFEMDKIYNFLSLPAFEHDFNNVEQLTKEDDEIYGIFGDHKIQKVVKSQPQDYEEVLTKQISDKIKFSYQWFFDYFGYE